MPTSRWVTYGVYTGDDGRSRSLTKENWTSEADAKAWLATLALQMKDPHGVVVYLPLGRDYSTEREVVARIGGGKAWWE